MFMNILAVVTFLLVCVSLAFNVILSKEISDMKITYDLQILYMADKIREEESGGKM